MKLTHFTLAALALTFFLSCSNSKKNSSNDSDTATINSTTEITSSDNSTKLDSASIKFLRDAAIIEMANIEIGNKIIQLGTTNDILMFAKTLVKDQTASGNALKNLAAKKGFELPKTLPNEQIQTIKRLETFREDGKNEFFVDTMIKDYQTTIDIFAEAAKSTDPDIAAFAELKKPTLQKHYDEVIKIKKKIIESKAGQGEDPLKKSDQKNFEKSS
ncbi:MAG: DUF4142 domain-containing protein [Pedobacter sp.]|nr:MAG: DUF4142 domain-containing protein [Pedobacter sp.]